jgi:hypothetical protein
MIICYHLAPDELRVSHYGQPFDEPDVRGVCGIDESTKDITGSAVLASASSRFTRSPTARKRAGLGNLYRMLSGVSA